MEKMKEIGLLGLVLGLLVFSTPVMASQCDATVESIVKPREVNAGERVPVEVTYKLTSTSDHFGDKCEYLLESAIKPRRFGYQFSVALGSSEPICCQENDNYAAKRYTHEPTGGVDHTESKTITVDFTMTAPEEGMTDSCPPSGYDADSFWEGSGWYDVKAASYNGCADEVDSFEVHDSETEDIYIGTESDASSGFWERFVIWLGGLF